MESTPRENNPPSMENIGHPSPPRERYEHTKEKFILTIRDGTYKFAWNVVGVKTGGSRVGGPDLSI